jgi:hypothetical protein
MISGIQIASPGVAATHISEHSLLWMDQKLPDDTSKWGYCIDFLGIHVQFTNLFQQNLVDYQHVLNAFSLPSIKITSH